MCVSVYQKSVCKVYRTGLQSDWLSHARAAPFPFPLFHFPGIGVYESKENQVDLGFENISHSMFVSAETL